MAEQVIPSGTLKQVDIDSIIAEDRYREDFGDLEHLAESIKDKGVLQPITITPDLKLLAGERRLRASKLAGLKKIPALIRKVEGEIDAREIELIENTFRKSFAWPEECALIKEIDALYKAKDITWSNRKTAQLLEKGTASVSRALQLADYCEKIPELAEIKTADDAFKVVKKLEEQAVVTELRSRQDAAATNGSLERGVDMMLKIAKANYSIGDSFKGLAELRSNGVVHLIECDPPYGIDLAEQKQASETPANVVHGYNEIPRESYPTFLTNLTKELYRVAGKDCWLIFWFGPTWQREVLDALKAAQWLVDDIPGIWTKKTGQTNQPELYLARAYEPFFLCRKGQPAMAQRGRNNVFPFDVVPSSAKYHPTQRPIALIQELLETLTFPQATVLCPFLGSGATLRAAYYAGMKAFGWDLSSEYRDKFLLLVEQDSRNLDKEEKEADD